MNFQEMIKIYSPFILVSFSKFLFWYQIEKCAKIELSTLRRFCYWSTTFISCIFSNSSPIYRFIINLLAYSSWKWSSFARIMMRPLPLFSTPQVCVKKSRQFCTDDLSKVFGKNIILWFAVEKMFFYLLLICR